MRLVIQTTRLAEQLAKDLNAALSKYKSVIWLVPGGSNVPVSATASRLLDQSLTDKLTIMQTDERFVSLGSPDCNWLQLHEAGFVVGQARAYPMLTSDSQDLQATAAAYAEIVEREFDRADCIFGQFGFGADGHIAGIKPNSVAATSEALVAGYQADDFTRLTLTFKALRRVTIAKAFAYGEAKRPVVEKLSDATDAPLVDFPVGVLRDIPDSTIYNDLLEV